MILRATHYSHRWQTISIGLIKCIIQFCIFSDPVSVAQELPDIRSVETDLEVPVMVDAQPSAGLRVKRFLNLESSNRVYHSLYLPSDWHADKKLPILVELPGNGGFRNSLGDECTGRPEDASLGYGISAGKEFLWICCPFLNASGDDLAITWWGEAPTFKPAATIQYLNAAIDDACENFGGDASQLILCGFSRGAIACNYFGLHDDEIAKRWKAFVVCSHYDGVRKWPFPSSDRDSAAVRLARLENRKQFICGEGNQTQETENYLRPLTNAANLTFASTGFRNHSDRWALRPSESREKLRAWLREVVSQP